MEVDLFGEPIPEKKKRKRRQATGSAPKGKPVAEARQMDFTRPDLGDLVTRLKPLHRRLEADLNQTLASDARLQHQVERACEYLSRQQGVAVDKRQYIHTAATVYVLKALFLRVAEDYKLFPAHARKVSSRGDLFRALRDLAPRLTWSDYLEYAVRDLAYLPVAYDLFKETGYELVPPTGEMARALLDTLAALPSMWMMDTRILGDLYERLMDEAERKRLGYYTTPDFIIDFLLERTLEPAIGEFGVHELRYLDPACGTGHFLVRAYRWLDRHLAQDEPSLTALERFERIVQNNLFGIDISEFATRITLFRLFLEGVQLALREGQDTAKWGEDITFNVYTANSLIRPPQQEALPSLVQGQPPRREVDPVACWYGRELTHLRVDLRDALAKGFHVINANPPYVRIQKQGAEVVAPFNGSWQTVEFVQYLREHYQTVSGKFDLSVPFVERGLDLLVAGGVLGFITTGKFAKQTYGKKLAQLLSGEHYRLLFFGDLTDAQVFEAGTYPALIILQRPAKGTPVSADAVVEVLATYQPAAETGEDNWAAMRALLDRTGGDYFEEYAGNYQECQGHFRSHPWTLRRGKRDLLARIKAATDKTLADYGRIGVDFMSNADPVFCDYITDSFIRRHDLERKVCIPCLRGGNIRNWRITWHGNRKREQTYVLYTHDLETSELVSDFAQRFPGAYHFLLKYKDLLWARATWGRITYKEAGIPFFRLHQTNAQLNIPKITWPEVATHNHFVGWTAAEKLARHSCVNAYPGSEMEDDDLGLLTSFLNSSIFAYVVKAASTKLSGSTEAKARFRWRKNVVDEAPIASLDLLRDSTRFVHSSQQMEEVLQELQSTSVYAALRESTYGSTSDLQTIINKLRSEVQNRLDEVYRLQLELDQVSCELLGLDSAADRRVLQHPTFEKKKVTVDWEDEVRYEILDALCDLIEDLFSTQPALQERPLRPAEVAAGLAREPKFEPLRAVYYDGKPISAEQFARECLDWDCRPIPFDEDGVLAGRRPKRVDILHERFFRFDGVNRDLYGWTGWSPEAQANVFLTLAEKAEEKTPFYRWVARLIFLPEEAPDIEDPEVRAGLKELIGDVPPYPYVVME